MTFPETLDCGHPPRWTPNKPHPCGTVDPERAETFTTGTAKTTDGRTLCHPCAERRESDALRTESRVSAYLSSDVGPNHGTVTTWTGGVLFPLVTFHKARVGFGGAWRYYLKATDATGARWYGTGTGPGMFCQMRRAKATPAR